MNRKYVLKNRKRFYVFVMLLAITLSSTFLVGTVNGADTSKTCTSEAYTTVTVEKGDTLWDLAREHNKDGDIRQYIHKIEKANNLTDGIIFEGETLKLPV